MHRPEDKVIKNYFYIFAIFLSATTQAAVSNLNTDMPTHLEDAFPTNEGEWNIQVTGRHSELKDDETRFETIPEIRYGLIPGLHLAAQTRILSGSADKSGSGDVFLGAQYLLLPGPFLAIQGDVVIPSGKDSEGLDTKAKVLTSYPLSEGKYFVHGNIIWDRNEKAKATARENRYSAILGISGEMTEEIVWVFDVLRREEKIEDKETILAELGLRIDLITGYTLAAGAGAGFGDESPHYEASVGIQASYK